MITCCTAEKALIESGTQQCRKNYFRFTGETSMRCLRNTFVGKKSYDTECFLPVCKQNKEGREREGI